ncbi:nuclease domain-containing protein [Litorilituus sediminis]|uniref:DUF2357 domain-containing protein n=1 Tax=Litorilituus sediminis TaxID=718192 RepID=A0A4V0ZFS2_9GAMM|nr:nuclease domain-containing protein [Litorilituus sediminis]QBG34790.1 hypothetical protein EMK97_03060 [Litorilituus sediminis]
MELPGNIFEARYVRITWQDKSSALNIKTSKDSIEIIHGSETDFELEATAFSKVDIGVTGQLAFSVVDERITEPLCFDKPNGDRSQLIPVIDNETKRTWWVEGEIWFKGSRESKRKDKRWESEIFRSAGKVKLRVGKYSCSIKIRSHSFTYDQLENYLQDFKNELWYLILHETSYISAPVKEKQTRILDDSALDYFHRYIAFVEKILENPKLELRESQEQKNFRQVKPTPRTFMEIASSGFKTKLTSRAYKPSYNVPENQYVLFTANRLYNLLSNLGKVSSYVSKSLDEKVKAQEERLLNFSDNIKINRQAVESDYKELKEAVRQEQHMINVALAEQTEIDVYPDDSQYFDCELTLGSKLQSSGNPTFFLKSGLQPLIKPDYYLLSFDHAFTPLLKEWNTYRFKGKVSYKIYNKNDKKTHKISFLMINDLELINSKSEEKLNNLVRQAKKLKANNWLRPISASEKADQEQEKKEITAVIESARGAMTRNDTLSLKLSPTLKRLQKVLKKLQGLNIKQSSVFPNSMSFIQNPNYHGVHKLYKEIQTLSGIDENLFKGLEEAEDIGILNTSLIYERWCLLQIIKVLIDKFRFVPEQQWKKKLLAQIINAEPSKVRNVQIKFENSNTYRQISLWYEKELPLNEGQNTPRRADYVIDVHSYFTVQHPKNKRMVLDAKFYENINAMGGISEVVNNLYNFKNYSELGNNQVFILHPSLGAVPEIKTSQGWAENNYLGETRLFDWDEHYPNHRYGALLLSPIQSKGNYLDSLQMSLGMFLQYGVEDNYLSIENFNEWVIQQPGIHSNHGINPMPKEKLFCVVCGSTEHEYQVKPTPRGIKWICHCIDCKHQTFINYCGSCGNRIFKHGKSWSYHATQSMQPYNIKCPSCGEIALERK